MQEDVDADMQVEPLIKAGKAEKIIKFEVQVYRVRTQSYLIDVQRLEGHLYLFLDLCSQLLSSLSPSPTNGEANPRVAGAAP
jgi:hypothetical protein